jgi:hypothetical protein
MIAILGPGRFEPDDNDPIVGPDVDLVGCRGMLNALALTLIGIAIVGAIWLLL